MPQQPRRSPAYEDDAGGGPYADGHRHPLQDPVHKHRDAGHMHLGLKIGGDGVDLQMSAYGINPAELIYCTAVSAALLLGRFLHRSHSGGRA